MKTLPELYEEVIYARESVTACEDIVNCCAPHEKRLAHKDLIHAKAILKEAKSELTNRLIQLGRKSSKSNRGIQKIGF